MDGDDVEARLEAVERTLADGETDLSEVADVAEHRRDLADLRERVEELESQVTELSAGLQAVRGYVGNVRSVNRDVERRADAALAKVEELERRETDADGPRPDECSADPSETGRSDDRFGDGRETASRTDRKHGDGRESPGDIARRITGREGDRRGDGRQPARRRDRAEPPRERGGDRTGRDGGRVTSDGSGEGSDDGFLDGLRDAL